MIISPYLDSHITKLIVPWQTDTEPVDRCALADDRKNRWSWNINTYNLTELLRLDIPVQQAFHRGLMQLANKYEEKITSSQCDNGDNESDESAIRFACALHLRRKTTPATSVCEVRPTATPAELSGEWSRCKLYICCPCGQTFSEFSDLCDHQILEHGSVSYVHIELQDEDRRVADNLRREVGRCPIPAEPWYSDDGHAGNGAGVACTKCGCTASSVTELHAHILQCANHIVSSPVRKCARRSRLSRARWSNNAPGAGRGRSRGMQRCLSANFSGTKSVASSSPKDGMS